MPAIEGATLDSKTAAQYLGISESTLRQGRMNGERKAKCPVPPYIKMGRKILYLRCDLDKFLHNLRIDSRSEGNSRRTK